MTLGGDFLYQVGQITFHRDQLPKAIDQFCPPVFRIFNVGLVFLGPNGASEKVIPVYQSLKSFRGKTAGASITLAATDYVYRIRPALKKSPDSDSQSDAWTLFCFCRPRVLCVCVLSALCVFGFAKRGSGVPEKTKTDR